MSATYRICHKSKTCRVQSAGYADPCGRGFVAAGKSQRSEQGASFLFSDLDISGDASVVPMTRSAIKRGKGYKGGRDSRTPTTRKRRCGPEHRCLLF